MFEENDNNTIKLSKIDLGECEDELRYNYSLHENISIIILSLEKDTNISSERDVQFEVYESLNKTRLDLSVCENIPIDIYIPLVLSEELNNLYNELKDLGYNLFDINDEFYQDICTPYKSQNDTDVLLGDRINYYYNNNETQCQSGCKFSNYSIEAQNLKCECNIEKITEINLKKGEDEGSKSLYKSFYEVLKYSNYKVLKCHKLAFKLTNFTKNMGCILTLIYFSVYLIFLLLYCIKGIAELKQDISIYINKDIKNLGKIPLFIHKVPEKLKNKNISDNFNYISRKSAKTLISDKNIILNKTKNINRKSVKIKNHVSKKSFNFDFPPRKTSSNSVVFQTNNIIILKDDLESKFKNRNQNIDLMRKSDKIKSTRKQSSELYSIQEKKREVNEEVLDNYELNDLDYVVALKLDKRSLIEIYWSILKREHLIIFTFFVKNDHNIFYIKISRLIFLICRDMVLNVFFFADETMHTMYLDYGKYNFAQQIPQIIYSSIVSQLIEVFLCYLSYTDKHYYQIKNLSNENRPYIFKIIRCITLKILFFYIFTLLVFIFGWYTVTCFCAVYENTQIAFIKDSLTSFGLGLLYPFILYLFPSILRKISLKYCNGKLSFIYSLSDIIPFF